MAEEEKKKKSKRPTAEKRLIQNTKRRLINRTFKSRVRTAVRELEGSIQGQGTTKPQEALNRVYSLMDKGVKRGIFSLNKAKRTKARFAAKVAG